jgi:hypothetical protein
MILDFGFSAYDDILFFNLGDMNLYCNNTLHVLSFKIQVSCT